MNWRKLFCAAVLAGGTAMAQSWELGMIGGFSYAPNLNVTSASASATAGIGRGGAAGVYGGEDTYRYFGGEVRYLYSFGNLRASSNDTSVSFGRRIHTITGDILGYLQPTGATVRPFVALGGGVEIVNGTGAESAAQPLGNFIELTHTRETLAVGDVGAGFKVRMGRHLNVRIEAHDYVGASPSKVIAPAPGASMERLMNNVVGTASIALTWGETSEGR